MKSQNKLKMEKTYRDITPYIPNILIDIISLEEVDTLETTLGNKQNVCETVLINSLTCVIVLNNGIKKTATLITSFK